MHTYEHLVRLVLKKHSCGMVWLVTLLAQQFVSISVDELDRMFCEVDLGQWKLGQCFISFHNPASATVIASICEQRSVLTYMTDETKRSGSLSKSTVSCQRLTNQKPHIRYHVSIDWVWLDYSQHSVHVKRCYIVNSLMNKTKTLAMTKTLTITKRWPTVVL